MAEKDIAEKTLEAYNDVFADIVNVLLFDGQRLVDEDALEDWKTHSSYKADGMLHDQGRDVAKVWKNGVMRLASIGIENQTNVDAQMALRIIGYDGAAYRSHYETKYSKCPVVTFLLYFGTEEKWADEISLKDYLDIPEELKDHVSDYRVKVFSVAYLPWAIVDKFTSDFRVVAEYFVQKRTQPNYTPSPQKLRHVKETLELLAVMGGKHKFIDVYNEFYGKDAMTMEGGSYTMSDFIGKMIDEAESKGITKGVLGTTIKYYKKGYLTKSEAAAELGITADEFIEKVNSYSDKTAQMCEHALA